MTYPEMDAQIVAILRTSSEPLCLYAAERIAELERQLTAGIEEAINGFLGARKNRVAPTEAPMADGTQEDARSATGPQSTDRA